MSPGTPQKSGVIERGFDTLYSWMCGIMVHVVLHEKLKIGPWRECMATTIKLENIMINPHEEACVFDKFGRILEQCELYVVFSA